MACEHKKEYEDYVEKYADCEQYCLERSWETRRLQKERYEDLKHCISCPSYREYWNQRGVVANRVAHDVEYERSDRRRIVFFCGCGRKFNSFVYAGSSFKLSLMTSEMMQMTFLQFTCYRMDECSYQGFSCAVDPVERLQKMRERANDVMKTFD